MSLHETDRRYFERQIAYGRPIVVLLALVALLEQGSWQDTIRMQRAVSFLITYFVLALLVVLFEKILSKRSWYLPLACDLIALGFFLVVTPSAVPAWFPYLFISYAAGIRWGSRVTLPLVGALAVILVLVTAVRGEFQWLRLLAWVALLIATFAAGAGFTFLGEQNRKFAEQNEFLSRITATMQVEQGLAECLRLFLDELTGSFGVEQGLLVYRDADLERIFLWHLKSGDRDRMIPESMPLARGDDFLLDDMDATICWNHLEGEGSGFGWDRRDGRALKILPRLAGITQKSLGVKSFMSVAFNQGGQAVGRIFLMNSRRSGKKPFSRHDLAWFERTSAHIASSVENLFLLRHLRARAIEGERSRISRDLHDGILQTLLSIEIQLDVLRRKVMIAPDQAFAGLANLQQTVKNESGELRHMVTDMRPLRVQSADLMDLMMGFAERYRNESGVALDVLADSGQVQAPDRVCRELFQIYREALNNIKKHAKASHVVVKLSQDDSRIVLVVDDNGEGFSFAGRFTGDELDRLRLGPISIKERTRTVGGVLTVESNPGHGARLTIEIPID